MKKKTLCVVLLVLSLMCSFTSCVDGNSQNPTHIHSYEEWETTKVATCIAVGTKERYCPCGEKQSATIPMTEHTYGEWEIVKNATFSENGSESRKCDCGKTETRDIPKLDSFIDKLNNMNYKVVECDEYFAQDFELCYELDINDYTIVEAFDVYVDDDYGAWMLTIVKCDTATTANRLASDLKPSFTSTEEMIIVIDTYVFFGYASAINDAIG